jgi:uncharacterized membrane protein YeaQ/YmgE (transglycosylase-associated protein family)
MPSIVWVIIIGAIVGASSRYLIPGKEQDGIIFTMVLSLGGAILFAFLGQWLGLYVEGEATEYFSAFIGAVIVVFIYKILFAKRI